MNPSHLYKEKSKRRSRKEKAKLFRRWKHNLCSLLAEYLQGPKIGLGERRKTNKCNTPVPIKQKNEKLENALQCADRNRAEGQGDGHHHSSLGSSSCVVVEDLKKQRTGSCISGKAVRKHVVCSSED
jgi:hypothetical protein